jgi:nucleoside-diphosphate-sugar epimerase
LGGDHPFHAVNVGSSRHHTVREFVETVFALLEWRPDELEFQTSRPVGVASRASDNALIRKLFGWEPQVSLSEGVARTLAWYADLAGRPQTAQELDQLLLAR